jgi:hypothetical protein
MKAILKSKRNGSSTLRMNSVNNKNSRTKFTDGEKVNMIERVQNIVETTGNSITDACKIVGIHATSYHLWNRTLAIQAAAALRKQPIPLPKSEITTTPTATATKAKACPGCGLHFGKLIEMIQGGLNFCPACGLPMAKINAMVANHDHQLKAVG